MEPGRELVGVVGGMGPLATVELMRMVVEETPASCDQEHIPMLVYSNPQVPDRTEAILRQGPSPVPALIESAQLLERAGATFLAFPCNTAHYFLPEVALKVSIPIINMIEETGVEVARAGMTRVGLLATDGTVKCGIYQRALETLGVDTLIPDDASQAAVMKSIYGVKKGIDLGEASRMLDPALKWMGERVGAVIAGCTELSVLLGDPGADLIVIDAMRVLAKRIVSRAMGAVASGAGGIGT